tara:strand:+ start:217 stop:669 length:453 start_codon:yes stop_codon:yes gene_type:complete
MFKTHDIIKRAFQEPRALADAIANDNKLQGLLIERQFFELVGGEFTNSNGYDGLVKGKKHEVKYTKYIKPGGYLRINSCNYNKKGFFDYMTVIDGLNDMLFSVPHDEWYARGHFNKSEFEWSSTYNKSDKLKVNNTKLLLEYQQYPKQKA